MGKPKWIAKAEYTTRKEMEEMLKEDGKDPNDFGIEDFQEVEISVVREDNDLGKKSYGWSGEDKIILFDELFDGSDFDEKVIKWCEEVAETICEALNRKGL